MKALGAIAVILAAVGCANEGDINPEHNNTVHLAGVIDNGTDGGLASYWKDGVYAKLTDDQVASQPNSLSVDESSVLIGGWKQGSPTRAVIWNNGAESIIENSFGSGAIAITQGSKLYATWYDLTLRWVFLKNGATLPMVDTALNFQPKALALLDDDLYISGNSLEPTQDGNQHAQTWKNGQLIFRESKVSYTTSIFIHRSDVYMAGFLYGGGYSNIACYWKNGKRVDLNDQSVGALAKSIFVTDDHVYVAGMINNLAVYWKDGTPTYLTSDVTHSMCNAIFVKGDDVHVAGIEQGYPAYWKNDVKQVIENQDKTGRILFISVGSN